MQPTPRGRGRGRGDRGSRGTRGTPTNPTNLPQARPYCPPRARHPDHPSVPPYGAIYPGSGVSIILKADQQTGHQVHGIVADLLTRGDHPRGVKVRLQDGRVGRVQRLVSVEEGARGEAIVGGAGAGLGRDGDGCGGGAGRGTGMRGGRIERDIRDEDEYLYDENRQPEVASLGLFAALEQADQRHRQERGGVMQKKEEIATCPVCGEFEGDERAVAHHVESHFEE